MTRRSGSVSTAALAICLATYLVTAASPALAASVTCRYDASGEGTVRVDVPVGSGVHVTLARFSSGDVVVAVDGDSRPLRRLSCTGGTKRNRATAVVVEGGRGSVASVTLKLAHWDRGTSVDVRTSSPHGMSLLGTGGPDRIHTGDLPFDLADATVDSLQLYGLDGDDDLSLDARAPISSAPSESPGPRFYGNQSYSTIFGGLGDDAISSSLEEGANLFGDQGDDTLEGGSGDDRLDGGEGDDVLDGRGGNDQLDDRYGANRLTGGPGNDGLSGGPAEDVIDAGSGVDEVWTGGGDDIAYGGRGDDYLHAGSPSWDYAKGSPRGDSVKLFGGPGGDTLEGDRGTDVLEGGSGDDFLFGVRGSDTLDGGDGDDTLQGGGGDDVLAGADGADVLLGLGGDDTLEGGAGQDALFGGGARSSALSTGRDVLDGGSGFDICRGYVEASQGAIEPTRVAYLNCESGDAVR